jgi:hypothetical protein
VYYLVLIWLQETSRGQFASTCVETVAQIIADAEGGLDYAGNYAFMNRFTPKPLPTIEVNLTVNLTVNLIQNLIKKSSRQLTIACCC